MPNIPDTLYSWSSTAASNQPDSSDPATVAGDMQAIQAAVRAWLASKGADIASAGTADLGAIAGYMHDITGTTAITSFGTVSAGITKVVKFEGALTLNHDATKLILLGGVNRTTADGDVGIYISEGSGNWRELAYSPKARVPKGYISAAQTITAAGSLTLAHGLGAQPTLVQAKLTCLTAEHGYSIGDEVEIGLGADGASGRGVSVVPDATNLNVRFGADGGGTATFNILVKNTGAGNAITNSSWNIIFYAWVL